MTKQLFDKIESYMLKNMDDSAHDREHVYRVLNFALDITSYEQGVDTDVLIIACLLHDIGRKDQFRDNTICHAKAGSEYAYAHLLGIGLPESTAAHVRDCILTHRFRSDNPPDSIEARILFDADKLDAAGALGIARTLIYQGIVSNPIYTLDQDNSIMDGSYGDAPSFFHEYKYKLEGIYDKFYTKRGMRIAKEHRKTAISFYDSLLKEVNDCYTAGQRILTEILEDNTYAY